MYLLLFSLSKVPRTPPPWVGHLEALWLSDTLTIFVIRSSTLPENREQFCMSIVKVKPFDTGRGELFLAVTHSVSSVGFSLFLIVYQGNLDSCMYFTISVVFD